MKQLRTDVQKDYSEHKKKELESGPKASYGYGGKFGVQQDRMDKVNSECKQNLQLVSFTALEIIDSNFSRLKMQKKKKREKKKI